MKPHVTFCVSATREAIEKLSGPKVGASYVPNPTVSEYAAVLRFPDIKVVVSGELERSLRKLDALPGHRLVIARDLTVEARCFAAAAQCDVITTREFGWTDQSYRNARQGKN